MSIAIAPLDPADDVTVGGVLELLAASWAVDVPDLPPPCPYRITGLLRHQVSSTRNEFRVARDGARVVGYLEVNLPLRDNTENSEVTLEVHPAYRRRGVGRALHAYTVDLLRDEGRKRYAARTPDATPGVAFATAMGARPALADVRRRLDLSAVDDEAHADLLAQAWHKADGYRLVQWRDAVPEELAADVGYLDARLVTDAPLGDLVWEPEAIDTARIREGEQARRVRGIRSYSTGALDPTGRLVALTAVGLQRSIEWHAYQWITIVDPDHRGHRLGTVVKLENLAYARRGEPALRVVDTWNAAVNDNMISINKTMGFRAAETWVNWQQEV